MYERFFAVVAFRVMLSVYRIQVSLNDICFSLLSLDSITEHLQLLTFEKREINLCRRQL